MKKRSLIIFTATAIILTACTGCKTSEKKSNAEIQKNEATSMEPSNYITVPLRANPSTGASWEIKIEDKTIVKLESDTYEQDESEPDMVGVPGTETFGFKCLKAGKTDVTFTYGQLWEGGEIWKVKNATITVDENLKGVIDFK